MSIIIHLVQTLFTKTTPLPALPVQNDDLSIKENELDIEKNNFNSFEIEDMTDEKIILKF